jgi:hypothetical protein
LPLKMDTPSSLAAKTRALGIPSQSVIVEVGIVHCSTYAGPWQTALMSFPER